MSMCAGVAAACCTLVVDGQCELDKLLPPDRLEGGDFGISVAIDGPYLLVGMRQLLFGGAGAAYLFELVDDEALLIGSLFADDGGPGHRFGNAVIATAI